MSRFDRYLLSQFMVLFGFFALVLVSIFWINKAVRMFDRLISDGQSAFVFLEFTALTLPGVIGVVLPIASFAGAVYVTNRLSTESELTVMQATGYSPWRLSRPALIFGVIVALMMSALVHILIPTSMYQLESRKAEVSRNVTAKLLTEGEFLHPAPGVTFYIREITPEGELRDVFLSDRRDRERPITYTSNRAYLVQEGGGTKLVMVAGLAQTLRAEGSRLFTTNFDDFSYDITSLVTRDTSSPVGLAFNTTHRLVLHADTVAKETDRSLDEITLEVHTRLSQVLFCIVAALIGFSTLLVGSYSRFGVWWQIVAAFVILVGVKLVESAIAGPVILNPKLWPLLYVPAICGMIATAILLGLAGRPSLLRGFSLRRHAAEAAP